MTAASIIRLSLATLLLATCPAVAQERPHTPPQGSAERAAILDALRLAVERRLKAHVTFADVLMNVQGEWAYVRAIPFVRPEESVDTLPDVRIDERYDPFVYALLRGGAGGWSIVETRMDVPPGASEWISWPALHHAPATLFERDPDEAALEAAMREFIDAMAAGSGDRFLALLPRTAAVRDVNTITPEFHAGSFTRRELAADFARKDDSYFTWFGEFDEQGAKMEDFYAERFQARENGTRRMWRRSGTTYYNPGTLRDGLFVGAAYVKWMKEGGRWVIQEMAYPAS